MSKINKEIESKESKEVDKNILNKKRKRNNKNNKEDNKNEENLDNIIIGDIKIKKNNLTTRIINSYENVKYEDKNKNNYDKSKENEEEIKDCEIFINDKKINFTYYYKFPSPGKYIIKYKFKRLLKITNFIFSDCNSLITLNLSNFNTQNLNI